MMHTVVQFSLILINIDALTITEILLEEYKNNLREKLKSYPS